MAQPVETATDYRHTHKHLGLITVNVYGFVFHVPSMLNKHANKHTDATKRIISPASRSNRPYRQTDQDLEQVIVMLMVKKGCGQTD